MRRARQIYRRQVCIPFRSEEEQCLLDLAARADDKSLGEFLRAAMYDRIQMNPEFMVHGLDNFARDVLQRAKAYAYKDLGDEH